MVLYVASQSPQLLAAMLQAGVFEQLVQGVISNFHLLALKARLLGWLGHTWAT